MRLAALFMALVLAAPAAAAATWGARPGAYADLGWIGELAGWCWTGQVPDRSGQPGESVECFTRQYDRVMRGDLAITYPGPPKPMSNTYRVESVFVWDSSRGVVHHTYWGSYGNYGSVEGRYEGDALVFGYVQGGLGQQAVRLVWRRPAEDRYTVTVQTRETPEAPWVDQSTDEFRRAGPAPKR